MKIFQLINGYFKGDGVGNVVTAIDGLLKRQGHDTGIYDQLLNFEDINNTDFSEENIVLYHVSMLVDPLVPYLKCRKILVFHNITDPELLIGPGLQQTRNWCSAGLYDIGGMSGYFESAIVFSEYSKNTLVRLGWDSRKIYEMPIMVRFGNLAQNYNQELVKRYSDGYTNIIFTGRVFPHKKQEDIIYAFEEYRRVYNKRSRLFLIGSLGNQNYFNALQALVQELGISDSVIFTGKAPFEEYLAYYHLADIFLCMSAHEGFCIPLVEALFFNIPIIAIAGTAIQDTLGGRGVLLDAREPGIVAQEINHIMSDDAYRKNVIEGEKKRLAELQPEVVERQYIKVLDKCISASARQLIHQTFKEYSALSIGITIPSILRGESQTNIVYGYGAAGHRLLRYMNEECVTVTGVCDKGKGGSVEDDIKILTPEDAVQKYPTANYIISIQAKKVVKSVMCMLTGFGIALDHIYVFDEYCGTIL